MGISLKKFINDYTPAGALYKAATGGGQLTDDAGKAWSKAIDDTGISANLGDAGQAAVNTVQDVATTIYDASPAKLITTGSNSITDAAGDLWSKASEGVSNAADTVTNTVTNTVSNVKETVKETVQNVTKGVTGALPVLAIGGAVVLGLSLLLRR